MTEWFRWFARTVSNACATWQAFIINLALIVIWLCGGPYFDWSTPYQLIVNDTTTIITFLLLFLVMNTQARDTAQTLLKLDEIIAALPRADNRMIKLEDLSEIQIAALRKQLNKLGDTKQVSPMKPSEI